VPVSTSVISSTTGYPVAPLVARILPSQHRFRPVSGALIETQPSKATVRYRPNRTPGVDGCATGPASVSNSAFTGAAPTRRRRSRKALSDTDTRSPAPRPASMLAHTFAEPTPGKRARARTKYTPTRDGSRRRCSVARVCASTASTSSKGTCRVSSPR